MVIENSRNRSIAETEERTDFYYRALDSAEENYPRMLEKSLAISVHDLPTSVRDLSGEKSLSVSARNFRLEKSENYKNILTRKQSE